MSRKEKDFGFEGLIDEKLIAKMVEKKVSAAFEKGTELGIKAGTKVGAEAGAKEAQKILENQEIVVDGKKITVKYDNKEAIAKKVIKAVEESIDGNKIAKQAINKTVKLGVKIDPYINTTSHYSTKYFKQQVQKFYDDLQFENTNGTVVEKDFDKTSNRNFIGYYTRAKADKISFAKEEKQLYEAMYNTMIQGESKFKELAEATNQVYKERLDVINAEKQEMEEKRAAEKKARNEQKEAIRKQISEAAKEKAREIEQQKNAEIAAKEQEIENLRQENNALRVKVKEPSQKEQEVYTAQVSDTSSVLGIDNTNLKLDEKIEKTKELIKLAKILSTQSRIAELENDSDITEEQEDELQDLQIALSNAEYAIADFKEEFKGLSIELKSGNVITATADSLEKLANIKAGNIKNITMEYTDFQKTLVDVENALDHLDGGSPLSMAGYYASSGSWGEMLDVISSKTVEEFRTAFNMSEEEAIDFFNKIQLLNENLWNSNGDFTSDNSVIKVLNEVAEITQNKYKEIALQVVSAFEVAEQAAKDSGKELKDYLDDVDYWKKQANTIISSPFQIQELDKLLPSPDDDPVLYHNQTSLPSDDISQLIEKSEQEIKEFKEAEEQASEEAKKLAKTIAEEFGAKSKSTIQKLGLEIDSILAKLREANSTDMSDDEFDFFMNTPPNYRSVLDILAEDANVATTAIGNTQDNYNKLREYVSKSNIRNDSSFKTEFGDDWLNVRNTIGAKVIRNNQGSDIMIFLKDLNHELGTTFDTSGNAADGIRQLYEALEDGKQEQKDLTFSTLVNEGALDHIQSTIEGNDQVIESNEQVISSEDKKRRYKIVARAEIPKLVHQESAAVVESNNEIITSNRDVIESEKAKRKIISTTESDNLWSKTYQDEIGRTFSIGEKKNKKGVWEPYFKELTSYTQLEREAIKYTNELILAQAHLAKEKQNSKPDKNIITSINEQIKLLASRLKDVKKQASLYDQEGGLGKEYNFGLFNERVKKSTDEYAANIKVKTAKEIRMENEKNLRLLKQEQDALNRSNSFLNDQKIKVKEIVATYDKTKQAKKPITNITDKAQLDQMVGDLNSKIQKYYNTQHTLSSREKDDLKEEIALLKLKRTELQNKEYGSTALSPTELQSNKDIIRENYDYLISKAKEAGSHTSTLVSKLEQERLTINSIGDSNGIKIATDHLKAYRAEFSRLQQEQKASNSVFKQNVDAINKYAKAQDNLNELNKKKVLNNASDPYLAKNIEIVKDQISNLEQKALDAAIALDHMFKSGKISAEEYNDNLKVFNDAYHNTGNSSDFLKIALDTQISDHATDIDNVRKAYDELHISAAEVTKKLINLENKFQVLKASQNLSIDERIKAEEEFQEELKRTNTLLDSDTSTFKQKPTGKNIGIFPDFESAKEGAKEYARSLGDITKELQYSDLPNKSGIYTMTTEIRNASGEVKKLVFNWKDAASAMTVSTKMIKTELTGLPGIIQQIGKKINSLGVYWFANMFSPMDLYQYGKKWFDYAKQYDDSLTSMRKVSNESMETLQDFQKESFELADAVGTTASQLQNSTTDFLRLGESLNQAKQSAQEANILYNVSEFDNIEDATNSLISMSQAYDELDKMDIIDKLNIVGNNYAIATDELALALQNSSSALKVAGNDIDESIALATAANTVIQDYSKVSAGIRTVSMRITGATAEELEKAGEDTDGLIETTAKLEDQVKSLTAVNGKMGISLLDANGNFRSTYDILLDIAEIWDEIGEQDKLDGNNRQNVLLESLAGKNRASILAAILQNPDILKSVYETSSYESEGSAQQELEKQLESISGHVAKLQNQWQNLWAETANRDVINWFLDLATSVLKVADNFGIVKTLLVGGGGIFAALKMSKGDGRLKMSSLNHKYAVYNKRPCGYTSFLIMLCEIHIDKRSLNMLGSGLTPWYSPIMAT